MRLLENFFWEQLTDYIHDNDSYRDNQGKGLLQRYLSIFGKELDEELIPKIENLIDELDPEVAANESLSLIAYQLGNPLDVLDDIQVYRMILTQIISIYKLKGTSKSYEIYFGLLGYSITIEEFFPPENDFDNGLIFDGPATSSETVPITDQVYFDTSTCDIGCTEYSITYSNLPGKTGGEFSEEQEEKIRTSIKLYLEPINAKLRDLTYAA